MSRKNRNKNLIAQRALRKSGSFKETDNLARLTSTVCNTRCTTLEHTTRHLNTPKHTTPQWNTLEHTSQALKRRKTPLNACHLHTTHCNTLQHTAKRYNTLQHTATHRPKPAEEEKAANASHLHTATRYNTLQHAATRCNTLQHAATRCNTLQYSATHLLSPAEEEEAADACHLSYQHGQSHVPPQALQHLATASHT